jgi:putative FmdB family regulatory protein
MPIYEFYCPGCHVLFHFLSRSVNTTKRPLCPRCGKKRLQRQVSLFAVTGRAEEGGEEDLPIDETRLERAMETLAGEAENMDENDPRQAADLMRRMSRMTGMEYGENMEEALRRMEAGEDPEAIEQEMGELLDGEEPLFGAAKRVRNRAAAPARDETLYEM